MSSSQLLRGLNDNKDLISLQGNIHHQYFSKPLVRQIHLLFILVKSNLVFLADPGKERGFSTNTSVTDSFIH